MGIKIISDSGCDLPQELINRYDIDIIPIFVLEGEKEFLDKVNITPEEVFQNMKNGVVYKTAQITPEIFVNKFKEYAIDNTSIIYLSLSGELSGTYESAVLAKGIVESEYPDADISIIDSKSASGGQGFVVLEAAKMAESNMEKEKLLERLDLVIKNIEHIFTIDDMEYLYRGGRISRAQNVIGGLLSIKPILCIREGKLEPLEKVRGKNKVLKSIIDIVKKIKGDTDLRKQTIIISHADNMEAAIRLKDMMIEEFDIEDAIINTIGSVIGAHAGPGTVSVFFLRKNV